MEFLGFGEMPRGGTKEQYHEIWLDLIIKLKHWPTEPMAVFHQTLDLFSVEAWETPEARHDYMEGAAALWMALDDEASPS